MYNVEVGEIAALCSCGFVFDWCYIKNDDKGEEQKAEIEKKSLNISGKIS
jgi:hypothetical protein